MRLDYTACKHLHTKFIHSSLTLRVRTVSSLSGAFQPNKMTLEKKLQQYMKKTHNITEMKTYAVMPVADIPSALPPAPQCSVLQTELHTTSINCSQKATQ